MTASVPVPVWVFLLFILFCSLWQVCITIQLRVLKDLFDLYWHAQYDEVDDDGTTTD